MKFRYHLSVLAAGFALAVLGTAVAGAQDTLLNVSYDPTDFAVLHAGSALVASAPSVRASRPVRSSTGWRPMW